MAEELIVAQNASKKEQYENLLPQIKGLVTGEEDLVANLANIASVLRYGMNFFWVGFYIVKGDELVLGPFQGPIACTRIKKGKGVCGTSWAEGKTIIVDDVEQFPGHIACSSDSKSEIVLPAFKNGEVALILDVDSDQLSDFDETDQHYLEQLMRLIDTLI
ncbi:MAG: GAF domain-containing protein [Bacteroidota bacterium]